jgi:hypothetical protein
MNTKLYAIALAALIFVTSSCHRYYTNTNFDTATVNHKTVAILPANVILTGNKPKKMTSDDIAKQELAESNTFQQSLYNNILRHANSKKYETSIQVQPIEKTAELLKNNSIDFKEVATTSDETLCKLLNVDAVVRLKVQKTRYMSGLVSFGADILNDILFGSVGVFIPGTMTPVPNAPTKTDDVIADCTVQSNSTVLWNDNYKQQANWQRPANDIVENVTNSFGKHFPYRKKKV